MKKTISHSSPPSKLPEDLPQDIKYDVASFLSDRDLVNLSLTSKDNKKDYFGFITKVLNSFAEFHDFAAAQETEKPVRLLVSQNDFSKAELLAALQSIKLLNINTTLNLNISNPLQLIEDQSLETLSNLKINGSGISALNLKFKVTEPAEVSVVQEIINSPDDRRNISLAISNTCKELEDDARAQYEDAMETEITNLFEEKNGIKSLVFFNIFPMTRILSNLFNRTSEVEALEFYSSDLSLEDGEQVLTAITFPQNRIHTLKLDANSSEYLADSDWFSEFSLAANNPSNNLRNVRLPIFYDKDNASFVAYALESANNKIEILQLEELTAENLSIFNRAFLSKNCKVKVLTLTELHEENITQADLDVFVQEVLANPRCRIMEVNVENEELQNFLDSVIAEREFEKSHNPLSILADAAESFSAAASSSSPSSAAIVYEEPDSRKRKEFKDEDKSCDPKRSRVESSSVSSASAEALLMELKNRTP